MNQTKPVVIYSVVSDPFRFGFLIMARTVLQNNPNLSIRFCILCHPEICPLSQENVAWLQRHLPGLHVREVDLSAYGNIFTLRDQVFKTPPRLWAAFLILEVFRDESPDEYVLCLDSDMICMAPFDDELLRESGFAAVEARTDDGAPRGFFNTGVMAIGPDCRGPKSYAKIMATSDTSRYEPSMGRADQALLALIYRPDNAISLPWRYNVTKRHVPAEGASEFLAGMSTVFFHFVGEKPWHISLDERDRHDQETVAIWDEAVKQNLSLEEQLTYYEMWRDASRSRARAHIDELAAQGIRDVYGAAGRRRRRERKGSKLPFSKLVRRLRRVPVQAARAMQKFRQPH